VVASAAVGAVGWPLIGALHVEFEDLAAQITAGANVPLLDELLAHIDRFFGTEERLMTQAGFPALACHQREHAEVHAVVVEARRRLAAGAPEFAQRLAVALPKWFSLHAGGMDSAPSANDAVLFLRSS
jgi:hemerythrin-like metal-binding protein